MSSEHKGSGFGSKMTYGSGFFHMRIKVLESDSARVVTTYYICECFRPNYFDMYDIGMTKRAGLLRQEKRARKYTMPRLRTGWQAKARRAEAGHGLKHQPGPFCHA